VCRFGNVFRKEKNSYDFTTSVEDEKKFYYKTTCLPSFSRLPLRRAFVTGSLVCAVCESFGNIFLPFQLGNAMQINGRGILSRCQRESKQPSGESCIGCCELQ
jgi:hypothetical protein